MSILQEILHVANKDFQLQYVNVSKTLYVVLRSQEAAIVANAAMHAFSALHHQQQEGAEAATRREHAREGGSREAPHERVHGMVTCAATRDVHGATRSPQH